METERIITQTPRATEATAILVIGREKRDLSAEFFSMRFAMYLSNPATKLNE